MQSDQFAELLNKLDKLIKSLDDLNMRFDQIKKPENQPMKGKVKK